MPSGAKIRNVCKEEMRKNLAVLAESPRQNRFFFQQSFQAATLKQWLTRAPENAGGNHDIPFEALFTLSVAGHIDMLFFRCFCL